MMIMTRSLDGVEWKSKTSCPDMDYEEKRRGPRILHKPTDSNKNIVNKKDVDMS